MRRRYSDGIDDRREEATKFELRDVVIFPSEKVTVGTMQRPYMRLQASIEDAPNIVNGREISQEWTQVVQLLIMRIGEP